MVERGGLENRCAFTGTEGSNPSLSATLEHKCERRSPPILRHLKPPEPAAGHCHIFGRGTRGAGEATGTYATRTAACHSAKGAAGNEVALDVEAVVDGGMGGEESLRRAWLLEADPSSLSSPHRLMGVFGTIVQPTTGPMAVFQTELAQCSAVGPQLVAPRLDQEIENLSFGVDRAPQVHRPPAD